MGLEPWAMGRESCGKLRRGSTIFSEPFALGL